jgi:hypothetical protein
MALKSKAIEQVRQDVPVLKDAVARVNLNVPAKVRKAWKQAALDMDTDVSSLIIEAMSKYLNTHKSK